MNMLQLVVNTSQTILSSNSLFFKTDNFLKQTKDITQVDTLLNKVAETILLNINNSIFSVRNSEKSCFSATTHDNQYSFFFKFGYQIDGGLNKNDIVFFDCVLSKKFSMRTDEYVKSKANIKVTIKQEETTSKNFNKLYLISNVSGVNLPRLSAEQKEIVETIDKNVLVQGVAGSGKTNICIDKIIFTACKNYSGKVLYTTFSRGLLVDTKLRIENYKKDLESILDDYREKRIKFLDSDHKKALENKLGIYFFSDDDDHIFAKIEKVLNYLNNKVDYLLIEDIYKAKFGADCKFVNEDYFIKEYCKNTANHQIEKNFAKLSNHSKEIIYKEIYGMILGAYSLTDKKDIASLEEYVIKRQSSFSRQECEMIYQIAIDYKKYCDKNNLLDNNFASKQLLEVIDDFEYSLAIIDEVQDYTQANLCVFKKLSLKLFCVGDALQMINPSYFNFGYLKNLLYEKNLVDVRELKFNYRNTKKITEIIDNLGEINKQEFGSHSFVLKGQSVDDGIESNAVFVRDKDFAKNVANRGYEDITFVVANQQEKKELSNIVKSQEILTVSEIKGLERNNIVAYNLLSTNSDKWKALQRNKINHKLADENSVYRYYYNLFYVGLSRAKQNLFVFENEELQQFENFFKMNFERRSSSETMKLLDKLVSKAEFSQQELQNRVNEFIKLGQYDNARFAASKIKNYDVQVDALRTIEISEEYVSRGDYRSAGIKFWEYGMLSQAKNQFKLSNDTMLIELIDMCNKSSNTDLNIDIVNYFDDVKDNPQAQAFIVDTIKKDIASLKSSFAKIKDNFKKGRK